MARFLTQYRDLSFEYHENIFKTDHKRQTQTVAIAYKGSMVQAAFSHDMHAGDGWCKVGDSFFNKTGCR
jgi:hypothetical protein